jgi:hypothetical protein
MKREIGGKISIKTASLNKRMILKVCGRRDMGRPRQRWRET